MNMSNLGNPIVSTNVPDVNGDDCVGDLGECHDLSQFKRHRRPPFRQESRETDIYVRMASSRNPRALQTIVKRVQKLLREKKYPVRIYALGAGNQLHSRFADQLLIDISHLIHR